ncbi:hypothetical protein VTN02DRAFT_1752 [Thermoascus thermophilus]
MLSLPSGQTVHRTQPAGSDTLHAASPTQISRPDLRCGVWLVPTGQGGSTARHRSKKKLLSRQLRSACAREAQVRKDT